LVRALDDSDLVQGTTLPAQGSRIDPGSHTMRVVAENGLYETCNMGYRRSVLERLHGFDEGFRHPYGEDVDLAWRAKALGATTAFTAEAVVRHDVVMPTLRDRLRHARRLEGAVRLAARHPGLRKHFHGSWFRPTHPPALLAGAALTVAAATLLWLPWFVAVFVAVAGVAPYMWLRLTRYPVAATRRRALLRLVPSLVEELVQVGVLTVASLRHGVLLL
jgi:hypothetical protein